MAVAHHARLSGTTAFHCGLEDCQAWYGDAAHHAPKQYAPGRDALYRQLEKERVDLTELRLKARPKSHTPEDGTERMAAE